MPDDRWRDSGAFIVSEVLTSQFARAFCVCDADCTTPARRASGADARPPARLQTALSSLNFGCKADGNPVLKRGRTCRHGSQLQAAHTFGCRENASDESSSDTKYRSSGHFRTFPDGCASVHKRVRYHGEEPGSSPASRFIFQDFVSPVFTRRRRARVNEAARAG